MRGALFTILQRENKFAALGVCYVNLFWVGDVRAALFTISVSKINLHYREWMSICFRSKDFPAMIHCLPKRMGPCLPFPIYKTNRTPGSRHQCRIPEQLDHAPSEVHQRLTRCEILKYKINSTLLYLLYDCKYTVFKWLAFSPLSDVHIRRIYETVLRHVKNDNRFLAPLKGYLLASWGNLSYSEEKHKAKPPDYKCTILQ
jgi:hypothetical protein